MRINEGKNLWNPILSLGAAVVNKSKYGTAMDSILILVALVTLPCFVVYAFTGFWFILVIGCAPVIYFIRVHDHYMKNDPKMLRTEKHEETMYRIASGMGQKGKPLTEMGVDALPSVTATDVPTTNKAQLLTAKTRKGANE